MIRSPLDAEPRREPRSQMRLPGTRRNRRAFGEDLRRYQERIADLETDRDALRTQLRRLRGRVGKRRQNPDADETPRPEAQPDAATVVAQQPDANAPRDLETAARLLTELEQHKQKEMESQDQAHAAAVDNAYKLLSQGTYTNADPAAAKVLYERLSFLQQYEYADDAQRQQWLTAAKSQLEQFVPRKPAQVRATIGQIRALKQQEAALGGSSNRALDAQLLHAYRSLGTAFDCTAAEARALQKEIALLQQEEFQPAGPRWQVYKMRQGLLKSTHDALGDIITKNTGPSLWSRLRKMWARNPAEPPQANAV